MRIEHWLVIFSGTILSLFSAGHALLKKREPRSALGWVIFCLLMPFLGASIYFLFGINRIERRAFRLRNPEIRLGKAPQSLQPCEAPSARPVRRAGKKGARAGKMLGQPLLFHGREFAAECRIANHVPENLLPARLRGLASIGRTITGEPLLDGNSVTPLYNGEECYPAMLKAIEEAGEYIWLSSYIFDSDEIGRSFVAALDRARQRGVDVRVLLDGVGIMRSSPRADRLFRIKGIPTARFLPPSILPPQAYINMRNHRKLLLVDGRLAFTGGMNISARHMCFARRGSLRGPGLWQRVYVPNPESDVHFMFSGPVVARLEEVFACDWAFATGDTLSPPERQKEDFTGPALCRVIEDGPDSYLDYFNSTLQGVISAARKSVHLVTPYFLPSRDLISALQCASLRGLDVAVILPAKNDQPLPHWATFNLLWEFLERNVKIYYQPPPFCHTKLYLIDGHYAQIGSANLDPRSLRLNFELTVEVFDKKFCAGMEEHFQNLRASAKEYTWQDLNSRSLPVRLRDALCWLGSPYL